MNRFILQLIKYRRLYISTIFLRKNKAIIIIALLVISISTVAIHSIYKSVKISNQLSNLEKKIPSKEDSNSPSTTTSFVGLSADRGSDMPDERAGPQVRFVYVIPSDGEDRLFDSNGKISNAISSIQHWLIGETGGKKLSVDSFQTSFDIGFVKLDKTDNEMRAYGINLRDELERILKSKGFTKEQTIYAVFYDGSNDHACGGGAYPPTLPGTVAAIYLKGTPPNAPTCNSNDLGTSDTIPGYLELAMLHEIIHTLGYVPSCSLHHHQAGHVSAPTNDLMYAGNEAWAVPSLKLDIQNDDYYKHTISSCPDLEDSTYLVQQSSTPTLTPTPTLEPCTTPTTTNPQNPTVPPTVNPVSPSLDQEEKNFIRIINEYRTGLGRGVLRASVKLTKAAEWMSNDMATSGILSHTDSLGRAPNTRIGSFGYSASQIGENVAKNGPTGQNVFDAWYSSTQGHKEEMGKASSIAIGIARAQRDNFWFWTADFGSTLDQELQSASQVSLSSPCLPTTTTTPTIPISPQNSVLFLKISLPGIGQGSGNNNNPIKSSIAITISFTNPTIKKNVTGEIAYQSSSHKFEGDVDISTIPDGAYEVGVKLPNSLIEIYPNQLTISQSTKKYTLQTISLYMGDVNNDGVLSILDYTQFISCYKKNTSCTTIHKTMSDFNLDGAISLDDLNILQRSFSGIF